MTLIQTINLDGVNFRSSADQRAGPRRPPMNGYVGLYDELQAERRMPAGMTPQQREAFAAAVTALARAFRVYRERTGLEPVLVGGATVVMLTGGQFFSGDFDFLASNDQAMANCLKAAGFLEEDRGSNLRIGWYHPDHPLFGFQQVSGSLFDGRTERKRMIRIELRDGEAITVPPVEDLIADRLGQHAVGSSTDMSRLEQAKAMISVMETVDHAYLIRRVEEEGGDIRPLLAYLPADKPEG